jgi:exosortase
MNESLTRLRRVPLDGGLAVCTVALLTIWSYWPTLAAMAHKWTIDPQYSHGYLVPAFAIALLWLRRRRLQGVTWSWSWWGVALVAGAALLRVVSAYLNFDWLDAASLLPCLAGWFLLLGGRVALAWSAPSLAFLFFMIPLPYRVETSLGLPLQAVATFASTYLLQLLGFPALAEGNVILINDSRIGVVEACNGLSMLLVFFALATALIILTDRPWVDKALLLVSAVPIAIAANVLRITLTGVAHECLSHEFADRFFHDWAGWLMMPLALGLFYLEMWLLSRLLVETPDTPLGPAVAGTGGYPSPKKRVVRGRQLGSPL